MRAHAEAGDTVVVISATFEPIILRAMERHPFDNQISTRSERGHRRHLHRAVEGLPVEGEENAGCRAPLRRQPFGPGNWELAHATAATIIPTAPCCRPRSTPRRVARSAARPHRARKGLILDW